jgi:hypothetical protein
MWVLPDTFVTLERAKYRNTEAARFSYVENRSKDKRTHKTKHGHTQTQVQTCVQQWICSMELGEEGKGRERQSISDVMKRHICGGGGRKDVH